MTKPPLRDRIIPWYFVMAFMVVFAVNGVFVYMATHTHTGVVTEHAYEKGLDYNNVLSRQVAQDALGWQTELTLTENGAVLFSVLDAEGQPVEGAKVKAHFVWPAADGQDFSQTLTPKGNGQYEAAVSFPTKGQWDITVVATWNKQPYQMRKRVVIN